MTEGLLAEAHAKTVKRAREIVEAATDVAHLVDIVRRAAEIQDAERRDVHAINANTTYAEALIDLALEALRARSHSVWAGTRVELAQRRSLLSAVQALNRAVGEAMNPSEQVQR